MATTIASDSPFNDNERRTLLALVGAVIPASAKHAVPGADDPAIAADIVATATPHHKTIAAALRHLESMAEQRFHTGYADLDPVSRARLARQLTRSRFAGVGTLVTITAQCYYRDDRVMRSLDMEARPPFPQGFDIPQGDWSLLDPVKRRGRIYKDA